MSILYSGDFHANVVYEIESITKEALLKKYGPEKFSGIRCHIILGDGGFMWPGNHATDLANNEILAQRPFPILCVIGNHDPILGMGNVSEIDIGIGEKVLLVNNNDPFIAYLKRGKVYTIDGLKMLVLGGALSVDKERRKPNFSWWERGYWSEGEKRDLFELLKTDNVFDIVLTHTGPQRINQKLFGVNMYQYPKKFSDEVALLNDEIEKRVQCREWWCGHWHENRYYFDAETKRGYQYLYKDTKILEKLGEENAVMLHNEYGMAER
jgi:hypothetical protein